jgi:HAT1-interacting factor 1
VGDYDIAMAPLLYSYGRALYELVLTQQGVMGKEEVAKNTNTVKDEAAPSNPAFVFGGDGDDDDEDEDEEGEGDGDGEGAPEAADPDEPEDDFNAAWDVLDVARTIYMRELDKPDLPQEKIKATRLMLADCYLSLGDVSLETGE